MARTPRKRDPRARLESFDLFETLEVRDLMAADLQVLSQPGVGHPAQLSPNVSSHTLAAIHEATGVAVAHNDYGLSGAGQTVAVIDSGIAWDHYALGAGLGSGHRVVGGWDFTEENDADPYDDGPAGFHGTHVAGIVASSDSEHTGVAPQADIVALRVFNDQGRGRMEWIESSLNWVIENVDSFKHPITTVNMSIGTDWNSLTLPDYADLEDELQRLDEMGIFVAVAAGNSFDASQAGLSYPAASPHVTPVASETFAGVVSEFTQRSGNALVGPGEHIISTVPDYLDDFNGRADDFYAATGTSMASPYVAGASMLVREAMQRAGLKDISADSIREVLFETADKVTDVATGQTLHHINVAGAIKSVLTNQVPVPRQSGSTLIVQGTDAADEIRFDELGSVSINGVTHRYSVTEIERIEIDAGAGEDRLIVESRLDASRIRFAPKNLTLRSDGLRFAASDFERIDVHVHGERSTAQFMGGSGVDEQFIKSTHSWMQGDGFLNYVRGAETVRAWASDPLDTVVLYDSVGDDVLTSLATSTTIVGARNGVAFTNSAVGYPQVVVRADHGGFDRATFVGTQNDESIRVRPTDASLLSDNHFVYARGFDAVDVIGGGGLDTARLYDSPGDDVVTLGVGWHSISTPTSTATLTGFTRVEAFASEGDDEARLNGSRADEQFVAKPTHSWMELGQSINYASQFDRVLMEGGGGQDDTRLYDSSGNDHFELRPNAALVRAAQFQVDAFAMARVHAFSKEGHDVAQFVDSQNADRLYATRQGVWMRGVSQGVGFTTIAQDFAEVTTTASNEQDQLIVDALSVLSLDGGEAWLVEDEDLELVARGYRR